jgi:AbrB family looped-hinge helix DNA binding protein
MIATTLTSKWRVTVPKNVRDRLGIGPGSKVVFELTPQGDVLLRPLAARPARSSPFAEVRGSATVKMRTEEFMGYSRADRDQ